MVLAAVLAVTEFCPDDTIPASLPQVFQLPVQANGLCFWSCLYLACQASDREKWLWLSRPRSATGFPEFASVATLEDTLVTEWALSLNDGNLPCETRDRIEKKESAIHSDIEPWNSC